MMSTGYNKGSISGWTQNVYFLLQNFTLANNNSMTQSQTGVCFGDNWGSNLYSFTNASLTIEMAFSAAFASQAVFVALVDSTVTTNLQISNASIYLWLVNATTTGLYFGQSYSGKVSALTVTDLFINKTLKCFQSNGGTYTPTINSNVTGCT